MRGRTRRAGLGAEDGASLIEMALVIVFLLMLVAGIVDLGGAFQNFIIITNAAREGARTAARLPCKADNRELLRAAIIQATIDEAAGSNIDLGDDDITITPDPVATGCAAPGEPVRVTVTVQYRATLGPFLGVAEFPVRGSAAMAFFGND